MEICFKHLFLSFRNAHYESKSRSHGSFPPPPAAERFPLGVVATYNGGWRRATRVPGYTDSIETFTVPAPPDDFFWYSYFYSTRDPKATSYDVIRSTVATGNNAQGDFRLIAGSKTPGIFFGKPQTVDYDNHAKAGVHSLRYGFDWTIGGAQFGSLVTGMTEYGVKYQGESDALFLIRGPEGHDHHPAVREELTESR